MPAADATREIHQCPYTCLAYAPHLPNSRANTVIYTRNANYIAHAPSPHSTPTIRADGKLGLDEYSLFPQFHPTTFSPPFYHAFIPRRDVTNEGWVAWRPFRERDWLVRHDMPTTGRLAKEFARALADGLSTTKFEMEEALRTLSPNSSMNGRAVIERWQEAVLHSRDLQDLQLTKKVRPCFASRLVSRVADRGHNSKDCTLKIAAVQRALLVIAGFVQCRNTIETVWKGDPMKPFHVGEALHVRGMYTDADVMAHICLRLGVPVWRKAHGGEDFRAIPHLFQPYPSSTPVLTTWPIARAQTHGVVGSASRSSDRTHSRRRSRSPVPRRNASESESPVFHATVL
jgi:hypothetical protein